MSWPEPTKRLAGYFSIAAIFVSLVCSTADARATEITQHNTCADIMLLFARGSGQNPSALSVDDVFDEEFKEAEPESYSYFNWFKSHLDVEYPNVTYKPVSVHDFAGKYSDVGYRAVGVGFPLNTANSINADASWFPGDYRASVDEGVKETVGYLKDQIQLCPDQSIVVGGYSQGAQVVGDALFRLTDVERQKIVSVGFFGDPKFIASTDSIPDNFDKTVSFPWRRGDATNKDAGMLDPRIPYVPQDMALHTASYCNRTDIVCSGWTGLNKNFRESHGSYAAEPMRHTVNELVQWAAPYLSSAERAHGGLGTGGPTDPTPAQLAKARDIMFLLNDDGAQTVLQTFRYGLDPVLWPHTMQYASTQYGLKGFGEGEQSGQSLPRVNNVQALLPYTGYNPALPMTTSSNLSKAVATRYPFAQPQMGGGDYADPHGLAIEKSVFSGGWRPDAEKHLVLITDRPAKQNYSYNICNASVRSWLQVPNTNGYEACYTNFGHDVWPKSQHPEFCETVFLSITNETCANPLQLPGYTQFNTRTLQDGIKAAQSHNIIVDVVVPYKITDPYNQFGVDNMLNGLKGITQSTGGKFIYYDQRTQYDQTMLGDTLRQIFTHTPTNITFLPVTETPKTNKPTTFSISGKSSHSSYKWDFNNDGTWDEETTGPVAETTYTDSYSGFVRVLGVNTDGSAGGEGLLPVKVSAQTTEEPALPEVPAATATTGANGDITLIWEQQETGDLVVIDPTSGLPIANGPLRGGQTVFTPEHPYTELTIVVVTQTATSEPITVTVAPYEAPTVSEVQSANQSDPDPTLCYKLQTCHTWSSPEQEPQSPEQPAQVAVTAQYTPTRLNSDQPASQPVPQPNPQVAGQSDTRQLQAAQQPSFASNSPNQVQERTDVWFWYLLFVLITIIGILGVRQAIKNSKY